MYVRPKNNITQVEEELKKLAERLEARKLKELIQSEGYPYQISFYGIALNKTDNTTEYRRIEIFINEFPQEETFIYLRDFFNEYLPFKIYSIYTFDQVEKELDIRGEFE